MQTFYYLTYENAFVSEILSDNFKVSYEQSKRIVFEQKHIAIDFKKYLERITGSKFEIKHFKK